MLSATAYYSKQGAEFANVLASWTTSSNGSGGTSPSSFTGSHTFTIRAGQTLKTNTAEWTTNIPIAISGILILENTATKSFSNITVNSGGELRIENSSNTIFILGNLTVSTGGKMWHKVNYTSANYLQVTGNLDIQGAYDYAGYTPAIWMNGTGSKNINTGSSSVFYLLLRTGSFLASGNVTVDGPFYAMWNDNAGSFSTNGKNVVANWGLVNAGGTLNINGGSLTINGANGGLLSGNTVGGANGTVKMTTGTLTSNGINLGLDATYKSSLDISGGTLTSSGLNIYNSTSTFTCAGSPTININGTLLNAGTFTTSASGTPTIKITGDLNNTTTGKFLNAASSGPLVTIGNVSNYGSFTGTATASYSIKGNWLNNGTSTFSNSNIIFNGTSDQTISGNNTTTFNNLTINPSNGVVVKLNNTNILVNTNLSIQSGIFDLNLNSCNRATTGGILTIAANSKLKLGNNTGGKTGSNFPNNFSTLTLSPTSIVEYSGANTLNQTIFNAVAYGDLILSNSAGSGTALKTLTANITNIAGNLVVEENTSLDLSAFTANKISGTGNLTLASSATVKLSGVSGGSCGNNNFPSSFSNYSLNNNSTIEYYGSNQTICNLVTYGNLLLSNAGVKTAPSGTLTVKGNLINAGSTFNHNQGKVLLSGTNQQFSGLDFYSVELSSGGTKTLLSAGSAEKILQVTDATTFSLGNNDFRLLSSLNSTASFGEFPVGAALSYGTGKFVVQRYMPAKKAWRFVAAPVKVGTTIYDTWQQGGANTVGYGVEITGVNAAPLVNGLDVTSFSPSMKYYDASVSGEFVGITNTRTSSLGNEKGYMIFVRGDRTSTGASGTTSTTILNTRGELITGNKTYAVPNKGYASVGNPYASRIDLRTVFANGGIGGASGVTASVTVWDAQVGAGQYGVGLYRTYTRNNAGDFERTPGGIVNNFIESGQAFFVQSTSGGNLKLQENVKTIGSANASRETPGVFKRIRTNLYSITSTENILLDGTLIDTEEEYSMSIDNMDVSKTYNSGESIALTKATQNLIVERRNHFTINDTIQFQVKSLKQQTYQLEFVPQGLEITPGLIAYLEDNFLKTSSILSLTDTTRWNFIVTSAAASSVANRFRVVFKLAGVLPVTFTTVTANRNQDQSISIQWKVENELSLDNYIVERSGNGIQFLSLAKQNAVNKTTYNHQDLNPLSGDNYYRIKAVDKDGKWQYSSIVKVSDVKTSANLSIYPNPVVGKRISLQLNQFNKGTYQMQILTIAGQVMHNSQIEVSTTSMIKSIALGEIPSGTYVLKLQLPNGESVNRSVVIL